MRPNFLFFITDQQRHDHVGYAGNRVLKTPHLDALANSGSWFSRFYVASPTCMSNRAALMTGRMPSLNGVRFNGLPLDLDAVTFVDLLRSSGYRTALVGKSHLQGMTDAPSMAPKPKKPQGLRAPAEALAEARRTRHGPMDYAAEMQGRWAADSGHGDTIALPYYGFDEVEFCLGHGDQVGGHYRAWAEERSGTFRAGMEHARRVSEVDAPQVYQPALKEAAYPTRFVEERAIAFLERHAKSGKAPFFLQASFPDPHHPFTPPGRYYDLYPPQAVELPATFHGGNGPAIPPVQLLRAEYEAGAANPRWTFPFVCGEDQARDIIAKTYGQITMIDDAVGTVMATLNRLGLADNTVVCFLSDHGDYLGDHGLMLKGPMHYQSLIRVPCLWRDPDPTYRAGQVTGLASTLDLARTVLHRAGLAAFNGMQGLDLLPAMAGEGGLDERQLLIETTTQYPYLGFDDLVSVHTLVDARWRLSVWQGCSWGELYDLAQDPLEVENLWDAPQAAATRAALLLQLVQRMQDHQETSPYPLSVS